MSEDNEFVKGLKDKTIKHIKSLSRDAEIKAGGMHRPQVIPDKKKQTEKEKARKKVDLNKEDI